MVKATMTMLALLLQMPNAESMSTTMSTVSNGDLPCRKREI